MTVTPDTETEQELDDSLVAGIEAFYDLDSPTRETLHDYISAPLAAIRRQAAADALTEQARHFDGRARFWRGMQHAHEAKGRPESADPYRHYADQAHRTADYLRKEAKGIIAEGYEYTCEAGWDQCENRVPDAGDYCDQHEPEDDDRWAE
jgi:hypothetical protein